MTHLKFDMFMVAILKIYDRRYKSIIPICEVDKFMKDILEEYIRLGGTSKLEK